MPPIKRKKRERFQHFIKKWREFRQLSQEDVAALIEVDRTSISRVERGETPYDQDLLEKLSLVYRCDPDDLISVDPLEPDPLKLIWSSLQKADTQTKARALGYIESLLQKAG
jgi:transcriptional regulator with XRE-family HTH domain